MLYHFYIFRHMWMHEIVNTCSKYNNSYFIIVKLPGPSQNQGSIAKVLISASKN